MVVGRLAGAKREQLNVAMNIPEIDNATDRKVEEPMKDVSETMNGKDLVVLDHDGVLVVDSRDVATWVGKRHDNLLRDIQGYCEVLSNALKYEVVKFFLPSTYVDSKGETRSNYLVTRKGCDMVAHKLTGEKGILFTAEYVDRFYDMERKLSTTTTTEAFPLSQLLEMLSKSIRGIENHQAEQQLAIDKINRKVGKMQYV